MGSAAGTCEIVRLPEDLLSAALALTTPRDACRAAAVSRAFRDAAASDAVWARFLPRDLPPIDDGELSGPAPPSKKDRFLRLSDRRYPVLLADGQRIRPVPKNPLLVYGFKVRPAPSTAEVAVIIFFFDCSDRRTGLLLRSEHVVGQGEQLQVLHAASEGPAHLVGRRVLLALDESPRFQVRMAQPVSSNSHSNCSSIYVLRRMQSFFF
jgi:hypothetical protein